ncbi:hypothetical protein P0082_09300 [Candidatus Haliotispira prima]|uniref:Transmembrane protein n=1 Tax=Candidatus Haliotispira prima TaxID=3034016 RepID=A0ABY8MFG5_9SPIO|nr:hypothetical protein P0082_09300 [Candidatus Haliotispira prima]
MRFVPFVSFTPFVSRVFCALLLCYSIAALVPAVVPALLSPLVARGEGPEAQKDSPSPSKRGQNPEERAMYRALEEAEQRAESYPNLRVLATFPGPLKQKVDKDLAGRFGAIWSEPSLYEAFLWLANFGLVSFLSPSDRQVLANVLMQVLQVAADLIGVAEQAQAQGKEKSGEKQSYEGELGRIFIKDYFRRIADSPYPGQGSWLVLRIFLDPVNEADGQARRLSILYNAYRETAPQATMSRVAPLMQDSDKHPMQRSSVYPQKSNARLSYQYMYLIPQTESPDEQAEGGSTGERKKVVDRPWATPPGMGWKPPEADTPESGEDSGAESAKEGAADLAAGPAEEGWKAQRSRQARPLRYYRLSFIEQSQLYARPILHAQYSSAKYLEILRNYLRDGDSDNDSQIASAIQTLSRRELDTESDLLLQEVILYYYLLYLPARCNYFISSQQSRQQLNDAGPLLKNLWRVELPRIWNAIDMVRLRYSREFDRLLPG